MKDDPQACAAYNASAAAVRDLVPTSHRMVTYASNKKTDDVCLATVDVVSFNDYPGWYTESYETINATWASLANWSLSRYPTKPFLASETGAGAIFEWAHNASRVVDGYAVSAGSIPSGSDLGTNLTDWSGAVAWCNGTAACVGFTFRSAEERPTQPLKVYFKGKSSHNSDQQWRAWVKQDYDAGVKWGQPFQAAVVAADLQSALSLPTVSGVAVWQFSDVNADPSDFGHGQAPQVCPSCVYSTPYNASTPMNCSYITTSCFRPGGENHKGILDFWRRKKQAFGVAKALFADYSPEDETPLYTEQS